MSPQKTFFTMLGGVSLAVGFLAYQLLKSPYLDRDVSGPITISSEWSELTPDKPLKAERAEQELTLEFAEPVTPILEIWSLRLGDGSVTKPEAQLIDEQGEVSNLGSYALGPDGMGLYAGGGSSLPKDRKYVRARVRSDRPLKLSRVFWRCYNPWDKK